MLKQYIKPATKYFRLQVQPMMQLSGGTPGDIVLDGPDFPDLAPRNHNIFAGDDDSDDVEEEW